AVTYTATASDLVDGTIAPTCAPASGSTFPLGTTTVSCSATDAHSNTATGTFKVTVSHAGGGGDATAPVIDVPADITAVRTTAKGAPVAYDVTAIDDQDGAVTVDCVPPPGSFFPLGDTTVDCTASDAAGNTAHASFTVTVIKKDKSKPEITVPRDMTVEA